MTQASQNDIEGWFSVLRNMADEVAGADMKPAEREKVKLIANASLRIIESVVIDINSIARTLGRLPYMDIIGR